MNHLSFYNRNLAAPLSVNVKTISELWSSESYYKEPFQFHFIIWNLSNWEFHQNIHQISLDSAFYFTFFRRFYSFRFKLSHGSLALCPCDLLLILNFEECIYSCTTKNIFFPASSIFHTRISKKCVVHDVMVLLLNQ